jgi:putative ABC transport system ATP-binding protein
MEATTGQVERKKRLNLYKLRPKNFEGKDDVITFNDLSKTYNLEGREEKVVALKSVSLNANSEFYSIKQGEFVMIRGPSGGGKTTMLNLIGTIDNSSGGELYIMNKKINQDSTDEELSKLRLKHIGFVF